MWIPLNEGVLQERRRVKKFFFLLIVIFLMVNNTTNDSYLQRLLIPFYCYILGYILGGESDERQDI